MLKVCRRLCHATFERNVWVNCYNGSSLLLPEGPLPCQTTQQLEAILVRAAKIWTPDESTTLSRRKFPRLLPTYDFDAYVISGRYLQIAEGDIGISWYDLESTDLINPILTYPCHTVLPMPGYMNYSINANGEGPNSVWVSFVAGHPIRM